MCVYVWIGDPSYKSFVPGEKVKLYFDWPAGHNQVYHADLVIPDPEFKSHEIGSDDEFLIIASDGLWDVVSTTEAVSIARFKKRCFTFSAAWILT